MASIKENSASWGATLQDLFLHFGIYKRTQGRIARQVTCGAIWAALALMAWSMSNMGGSSSSRYLVPGLFFAAGLWLGYRIVNIPRFADFLISVEAEMTKVSWPSRGELFRSSLVVVFVIFAVAALLYGFDIFWQWLFQLLRVLRAS